MAGKARGYAPSQVDGLINRARSQYENPDNKLFDSSVLQSVIFDLVPEGYEPAAVDAAIARIADRLEQIDIEKRVLAGAKLQLVRDYEEQIARIASALAAGPDKLFGLEPLGYRRAEVRAAMRQLSVSEARVSDLDTVELRARTFSLARRGYSRLEVDEFMNLVASTILTQRAIY